MADIERRRELLRSLLFGIERTLDAIQTGRFDKIMDQEERLLNMRGIIEGAWSVGSLGDDAAWLALLEMVLEEVVDDGANE